MLMPIPQVPPGVCFTLVGHSRTNFENCICQWLWKEGNGIVRRDQPGCDSTLHTPTMWHNPNPTAYLVEVNPLAVELKEIE